MKTLRSQTKAARITLILVGWVFAICFMQNSALVEACQYQAVSDTTETSPIAISDNSITSAKEMSEPCDLTAKLFSSAKVNLEHMMVPLTLIALLIIAWISQQRPAFISFTEPIVAKYRVHLTLCVFRE